MLPRGQVIAQIRDRLPQDYKGERHVVIAKHLPSQSGQEWGRLRRGAGTFCNQAGHLAVLQPTLRRRVDGDVGDGLTGRQWALSETTTCGHYLFRGVNINCKPRDSLDEVIRRETRLSRTGGPCVSFLALS